MSSTSPLFASKLGGYGGIAVAAWLVTATATGYGVAAADTTGASTGSSSSSTSSSTGTTKTTTQPTSSSGAAHTTASASTKPKSNTAHAAIANATAKQASTTAAGVVGAVASVAQSAAKLTTTTATTAVKTLQATAVRSAVATPSIAAATAPATTTAAITQPTTSIATGPLSFLNNLNNFVTAILNPFLKPAPATPSPFTPVVWAVLGWVRRNLFNQSPTIKYNAAATTQTGQTVTGNIGATDPEGDTLTYKVTKQPQNGTVTIDQATGNFTYTPNDINYSAAQTDSFTVSVSDGKVNLLSLFTPHSAEATIDVTVLNPTVRRTILNMPSGVTDPQNPRFTQNGTSIDFAATQAGDSRTEIFQINVDGTHVECLTCGASPSETGNLAKPVPFDDGSGRVLVLVQRPGQSSRYDVLEVGPSGNELVPITTPASPAGVIAVDPQREMRISPDGTHALYSRIELDAGTGVLQIVPIVGTLTRTATGYEVDDARVVYPDGEGKQWTPDGKGVIILGGSYDEGNADDVEVNLATGAVTRVTANLDYDEDIDESPNEQWIAVGSLRGQDALTPMTRIQRPGFLPAYVSAPVYGEYSTPVNVSNQEWAVAETDELKGVNGIPLFVNGDGWAARSMPSWNADGTAVTFWESGVSDPTKTRLVVANLQYTTSVGPVAADTSTPDPTWAPSVGTYHPTTTPLPAVGTYAGAGGGTAMVSEAADPTNPKNTIRTVTYTNYVNADGEILNGTESADYGSTQSVVHYLADINVTGTHTGYLQADATVNAFQQSLTGYITSDVDGDIESIPDPSAATAAQQNA